MKSSSRLWLVFLGAVIGVLSGHLIAPMWIAIDVVGPSESELYQHRYLNAQFIKGTATAIGALIAARLTGLSIAATLAATVAVGFLHNFQQLVLGQWNFHVRVVWHSFIFTAPFLFSAFVVIGIWVSYLALIDPAGTRHAWRTALTEERTSNNDHEG